MDIKLGVFCCPNYGNDKLWLSKCLVAIILNNFKLIKKLLFMYLDIYLIQNQKKKHFSYLYIIKFIIRKFKKKMILF